MSRRVLIVPDKFKGTLTAQAAAECIAEGWREACPQDDLQLLPMSDGGDGFGDVLAGLLDVELRTTSTINAAHQPWSAAWWWDSSEQIAIIESARVIGLALLPPRQFHPFELDTCGLGAVLNAAADQQAIQCVVGIGGSATNDGGFGVARAVGWRFLDAAGELITRWTDLIRLMAIEHPKPGWRFPEIRVAVDVQNPLLGPVGASRVYGPQKGLRPEDFELAEACLQRLAERARADLGLDAVSTPGTGAAGGLGFGLNVFFRAQLESGFELFARYARLEDRVRAVDIVITGEGAIDDSTRMGKGVGEVANLCRRNGVPCIGIAGVVAPVGAAALSEDAFTAVHGIVPELASAEEACANPRSWLPRLAARVARQP
jgi:glycerate 2-kinase